MPKDARDFLQSEIQRKLTHCKSIIDKADEDGRDKTEEENAEIERTLVDVASMKSSIAELDANDRQREALDKALGPVTIAPEESKAGAKSLGEAFVKSEDFQAVKAAGFGGGKRFNVGVKIPGWSGGLVKATTVEGQVVDSSDTVNFPDVRTELYPLPFRRPMVASLFGQATTTANNVMLPQETVATNAAASRAEGGAKAASTITFDMVTEPVRSIATSIKVSDEILDDVPALMSYMNSRLALFVALTEEVQLISGNGTTPNISGILDRSIQTFTAATLGATILDAIYEAATAINVVSELEADALIVHPQDWVGIRLAKDQNDQYYGGGPFTGAYGNAPASGMPVTPNGTMDTLWGMQVLVTTAITRNTILVGAFKTGATLFRRSGITVNATNSNEDDFLHNLTAIRAEERLALFVHRVSAFLSLTSVDSIIDFS